MIAASDSTVLILKRDFIKNWPDLLKVRLYENLSRELCHIIENMNQVIAREDMLCTDKVQDVQKQLLTLGI